MLRIEKRLPEQAHLARSLLARAERLSLGYEDRRRSRLRARLASGEEVALLLPRGTVLRDKDVLVASDGRLVCVEAQPESALEITHADPAVLQRIAYHLGNRHVPVQLGVSRLVLAADPVLAEMARQLGGVVNAIKTAFEPELGAYGGGHRHGHADTFAEDDALAKTSYLAHWGVDQEAADKTLDAASSLHARHQASEQHRHLHDHAHPHTHGHGHDHRHDHGHDDSAEDHGH